MTPQLFTQWLEALGGRRFFLTVGAGIVDTALFAAGKLSESGYLQLTGATVVVYIAAKVYSEVKLNAKSNESVGPAGGSPSPDGGGSRGS